MKEGLKLIERKEFFHKMFLVNFSVLFFLGDNMQEGFCIFLVNFSVRFPFSDLHNLFAEAEDTILSSHWMEIQKEKYNLLDSASLYRVKETRCSDVPPG